MARHLVRLTYYSAVPDDLTKRDLREILAASQQKNRRLEITGGLGFNRRRFIQTLEGDRAAVTGLVQKIFADPRHTAPVITSCHEIVDRAFPDWSMMWLGEELFTEQLMRKYSANPNAVIDDLDDDQLERFVLDLGRELVQRRLDAVVEL
ncbi:MAG: BLUF domain-containing protein [Marivibrio sp.]|uniref:BLUF domain-containing protein n=1 Tax=Marivibrio sp. TaxID=2039719 RepID=UPI0032F05ADC